MGTVQKFRLSNFLKMLEHWELMRILLVTDFSDRSPKGLKSFWLWTHNMEIVTRNKSHRSNKHPKFPETFQNEPHASHQPPASPTWAVMCWVFTSCPISKPIVRPIYENTRDVWCFFLMPVVQWYNNDNISNLRQNWITPVWCHWRSWQKL